eukprot:TRINITY_DN6683_c0_g2_i3.p1 TRINITY_DN6683_c0_g2~~TRINITY_DN6683_c0_g2_i3.p1  ORF type:complete len:150 (+),score=31.40 TRINITY_DN6683_c0_g2_i3:1412-1861(+)
MGKMKEREKEQFLRKKKRTAAGEGHRSTSGGINLLDKGSGKRKGTIKKGIELLHKPNGEKKSIYRGGSKLLEPGAALVGSFGAAMLDWRRSAWISVLLCLALGGGTPSSLFYFFFYFLMCFSNRMVVRWSSSSSSSFLFSFHWNRERAQ